MFLVYAPHRRVYYAGRRWLIGPVEWVADERNAFHFMDEKSADRYAARYDAMVVNAIGGDDHGGHCPARW